MFNFFKNKAENKLEKNKNAFNILKNALSKTTDSIVNSVLSVTNSQETIDEFSLDDIESMLIKADLGVDLSVELVEKIKKANLKPNELKTFLKQEFIEILGDKKDDLKYDPDKLNVYFVVGVNGAGKTTLIGKLASKFKKEGAKVLLAAGDTFRAAAEEQLDIWSKRAGVDILRQDKADSASVVFKSLEKAKNENYNVVIIDSAGRLQNKFNLIEELKKIKGVISKKTDINDNLETLLVLDGTQGQNGLNQAQVFNEAVDITGIAITKLDGTSKGGIIFSIAKNLKLPTKLIGIGEGIDDLIPFNKNDFINALFE